MFVTTRSLTVPGVRIGLVPVMVLLSETLIPVTGCPPIVTMAPAAKSVPLTRMGIPTSAGPEVGTTEKGSRWENSEVLPPTWSVAVIEMRAPDSVATGRVTSMLASPLPFVVAVVVPR